MGRYLVLLGVAIVIVGLAWPWLVKLGLGRLPGDIHFQRGDSSFHFPITTSILVSLLLSLLLWIFRK